MVGVVGRAAERLGGLFEEAVFRGKMSVKEIVVALIL